tara:strand:+ start:12426 stop:12596 length:171 start_codon:yes stop_codon:yes gene_type:complete
VVDATRATIFKPRVAVLARLFTTPFVRVDVPVATVEWRARITEGTADLLPVDVFPA